MKKAPGSRAQKITEYGTLGNWNGLVGLFMG